MTNGLRSPRFSALRGYVSDAVGCAPDKVVAVSKFEDGNRHDVYKVSYLDAADVTNDVVVRVSLGGSQADCDQGEREARVLTTAGRLAAPLLYDFRRTSQWFDRPTMCMQFIAGHQKDLSSATPGEIEQLATVVAWVHGLPVEDLVDGTTADTVASYAQGRLQSILSTLGWVRDPVPTVIQAGLRSAADLVQRSWDTARAGQSFTRDQLLAVLHGDIGPGNTIWGPDPVLIDWEYTRLGDPADEIAYLFDQNGLEAPQREAFWRGYHRSISGPASAADVRDRVGWWESVTLLGSTLWWVERWVRRTDADAAGTVDQEVPRDPDYYLEHVSGRLDRLTELLANRP